MCRAMAAIISAFAGGATTYSCGQVAAYVFAKVQRVELTNSRRFSGNGTGISSSLWQDIDQRRDLRPPRQSLLEVAPVRRDPRERLRDVEQRARFGRSAGNG